MSEEEKLKDYIVSLKKLSKNIKFQNITNYVDPIKYSRKAHASVDLSLIHRFIPVPEIGYSTICYRATKIMEDTTQKHIHVESIYAFVYVDVSSDDKHIYVKPKFVCASPTFTSRDGEYRQRFIPFEQIILAKEKYPKIWETVESAVLDKMVHTYTADDAINPETTVKLIIGGEESHITSGDMILSADIYTDDDFEHTEVLKKWANESRMAINLFIAAWIIDGPNIKNNLDENHMNPNYKIIMEDDTEIFDELKGKDFNICRDILSYIQTDVECNSTNALKLGQKIIPLTVSEVLSNDMALGVWKEIVLANLCSNLVINGIAAGFAIYGPWFFLPNIDSSIFDNPAMHERFDFENEIIRINDLLKDAQNTAWNEGKLTSADMDSLAKQINDALRYSVSYLTLTDIALVSVSEWVGNTIRDIPRIQRNWRLNKQKVRWAETHMFDTGDIFIKYIFDWIYNCHTMNIKFGALHGDLHLNNITIQKFCQLTRVVDGVDEYKTGPNTPCSLYIIGAIDEDKEIDENILIFDSYGFCGGIIDFSRALLTDLSIIREIDIAFLADDSYVKKNQQEMLLRLLHKNFTELIEKNEDRIKALIIEKFALMMKIMFALDPFNICDNIYLLLSAEFPNAFKKLRDGREVRIPPAHNLSAEDEGAIDPEIPKMLAQIRDFCREYIVSNLHRVINGDINYPEDIEFIGAQIIRKFFGRFTFGARNLDLSKYIIYDIFNLNNELTYSAFKTADFEMKPEDLQTTIRSDRTREFHRKKIIDYVAMKKQIPEIKGRIETMRSHFKEPAKLPIESMWKYNF